MSTVKLLARRRFNYIDVTGVLALIGCVSGGKYLIGTAIWLLSILLSIVAESLADRKEKSA